MSKNREQFYKQRAEALAEEEKRAAIKSSWVSWLRVIVFLAGAGTTYYFFSTDNHTFGAVAVLVFYVMFILVIRWHSKLNFNYQQIALLHKINQEEVDRLQGRINKFDGGSAFIDGQHPYTSDLDIFGQNSLFQLINRSVTSIGKLKMAQWFQIAAPAQVVLQRQQAVAELAADSKLDWLQNLLALPRHFKHDDASAADFIHWFSDKSFYKNRGWLKVLIFVLPILTIGAIAAWAYGAVNGYTPVAFLALQYLIGYRFRLERDEYYDKSTRIFEAMRSYSKQLQHIEQKQFLLEVLQELQARLQQSGTKSSVIIDKLANIIDFFSWRLSTLMSFFLNATLMWDFIWIHRLEIWREKYLPQLEDMLETLSEIEALASIAAFQNAHPSYAIPVLSEQPFKLQVKDIVHPLIFSVTPVANDFEMQGAGKTIVLTGSNMSGKTTFLRTVGINMVMAQMGAPVCATSMIIAPAQVYTAMRTVDNLSENTSSFYAELKRLRVLLELTEQGQPVFYFLDEILKGTNSRDRHAGAMALIRQLHKRNASGFISTHDLELGNMEQELPGSVYNYSFNSDITGDEINFDYKLRQGICRSFNASKLMQLMGIELEEKV